MSSSKSVKRIRKLQKEVLDKKLKLYAKDSDIEDVVEKTIVFVKKNIEAFQKVFNKEFPPNKISDKDRRLSKSRNRKINNLVYSLGFAEYIKADKDDISSCIPKNDRLKDFLLKTDYVNENNLQQIQYLVLDYFSVFAGYLGWNHFISKYIDPDKKEESYIEILKEKIDKEINGESEANFKGEASGLNIEDLKDGQGEIITILEGLTKETLKKDIYIPNIKGVSLYKSIWNRLKLFFGINSWLYRFGKDAPLGLNEEALKEQVKNYISIDFQENITTKEDDYLYEDALGYLTHHVLKKHPLENGKITQFFFILASSGIGKTTLLLQLYLTAKKNYTSECNVYILPFYKWKELNAITRDQKRDAILLLDAIDEDFSLNSLESLDDIIDDFRKTTKDFSKVVIASRGEFFRKNKLIEKFTFKIGEHIDFSYQIISLCPFSEKQVQKYLKKKFINPSDLKKAKKIIELIGEDTFHRQFLISKINFLFDVLKDQKLLKQAKGYFLFEIMLNKWVQREKLTIQNAISNSKDKKVQAFKNTMLFSKVLAKCFLIEKDKTGFSFDEIQERVETKINQSKLLTNRTFLIRDIHDQYKFAHKSILEFFWAKLAIEDEVFDKNYFQNLNLNFATQMYQQGILIVISNVIKKLKKERLDSSVHFTIYDIEVEEYARDIRYEPYFLINEQGEQLPYKKTEWEPIKSLYNKITKHKEVKGVKFICDNDIINGRDFNSKDRKNSLLITIPILRFLTNLICLDLSNMDLIDEELNSFKIFTNTRVLNLRNNNLCDIHFPNSYFEHINIRDNFFYNNQELRLKSKIIIDNVEEANNDSLNLNLYNPKIKPLEKLILYTSDASREKKFSRIFFQYYSAIFFTGNLEKNYKEYEFEDFFFHSEGMFKNLDLAYNYIYISDLFIHSLKAVIDDATIPFKDKEIFKEGLESYKKFNNLFYKMIQHQERIPSIIADIKSVKHKIKFLYGSLLYNTENLTDLFLKQIRINLENSNWRVTKDKTNIFEDIDILYLLNELRQL